MTRLFCSTAVLAAFALYFFTSSVLAQVVPDNLSVHLKWQANPPEENVERYRVEWFDGQQRQWLNLGDVVSTIDALDLRFSTKVRWMKSTLEVGLELCFRVIAVRGSDESDPSENGCGEIQPARAVLPTDVDLSQPASPAVEFIYE